MAATDSRPITTTALTKSHTAVTSAAMNAAVVMANALSNLSLVSLQTKGATGLRGCGREPCTQIRSPRSEVGASVSGCGYLRPLVFRLLSRLECKRCFPTAAGVRPKEAGHRQRRHLHQRAIVDCCGHRILPNNCGGLDAREVPYQTRNVGDARWVSSRSAERRLRLCPTVCSHGSLPACWHAL
jgi:hypothetical protein